MIKPEHKEDCDHIIRQLFQHEVAQRRVINERDVIKAYFEIKQRVEKEFDGLDVNKLLSSSIY